LRYFENAGFVAFTKINWPEEKPEDNPSLQQITADKGEVKLLNEVLAESKRFRCETSRLVSTHQPK